MKKKLVLFATNGYTELQPTTILLYRDRQASQLSAHIPIGEGEDPRPAQISLNGNIYDLVWID